MKTSLQKKYYFYSLNLRIFLFYFIFLLHLPINSKQDKQNKHTLKQHIIFLFYKSKIARLYIIINIKK